MEVVALWRYPIKSLGGEQLDAIDVGPLGLNGDRRWGLVDNSTGFVLTARREPALLMASARLKGDAPVTTTSDGSELRTSADFSDWLGRSITLAAAGARGGVYENPLDVDNDADWMSWEGPSEAWHDSGSSRVSVVSTSTLGAWDQRRFRANIVATGEGEDEWVDRTVAIGPVRLTVTKPIVRCVMVTRPQPGLERDLDVLKTINRERGNTLSVGARVDEPGRIRVGDKVFPDPGES